jgi:hypothetical protein
VMVWQGDAVTTASATSEGGTGETFDRAVAASGSFRCR